MRCTVTPYVLSRETIRSDRMSTFAKENRHVVQPRDGYDARMPLNVEVEDEHDACEVAWVKFQNIDENRRTPDGGRSLMTGDMAQVVDEAGAETWWICCSVGWSQTVPPGAERVEIGKRETA